MTPSASTGQCLVRQQVEHHRAGVRTVTSTALVDHAHVILFGFDGLVRNVIAQHPASTIAH